MPNKRPHARYTRFAVATAVVGGCVLGTTFFVAASNAKRRADSAQYLRAQVPRESQDLGFVRSSTCRACHPGAYHSWHESYHRTMTQYASPESVVGDFENVELDYFSSTIRLQRNGDEFWAHEPNQSRRIVQTTGSHHYQMYWLESEHGNRLENLPFAYLIQDKKWVRRNDIFMIPPELAKKPESARIWNDACISCHTTQGQPRMDAQRLAADTQVGEIGIACESCHGPAEGHIAYHSNPINRYRGRLGASSPASLINPAELPSKRSAGVCGQCHSISGARDEAEWNLRGFDFRAGDDLQTKKAVLQHPARKQLPHNQGMRRDFLDKYFWSDGMVRVSGREYNGLIESPCYQRGELTCISCHSMHSSDPNDQLISGMESDQACLQCHTEIGNDLVAHTHHTAESSGSRCYNCHMPHTTFGLVKAIRSHEIDTPSVPASLTTGRPNACNLCHLDRSLGWANEHLAKWYGAQRAALNSDQAQISAALQWLIAGDAGQRALVAWHAGWKPAQKTSGTDWLAPFLAELLDDDYAVVRSIAGRSLKSLPGMEGVEFDYIAEADARRQVAEDVVRRWQGRPKAGSTPPSQAVLLDASGKINYGKLFELRARRDNRPVDLLE